MYCHYAEEYLTSFCIKKKLKKNSKISGNLKAKDNTGMRLVD